MKLVQLLLITVSLTVNSEVLIQTSHTLTKSKNSDGKSKDSLEKQKNALDTWILKEAIEQLEVRVNTLSDQVSELNTFKHSANQKIVQLEAKLKIDSKKFTMKDDQIRSLERSVRAFQSIHSHTQVKFVEVLKLTSVYNGTMQKINDFESNMLEMVSNVDENSKKNSRELMDLTDVIYFMEKNITKSMGKVDSVAGSFDILSSLQTQQSVDYVNLLRSVGIMESSNHQMQMDLHNFGKRLMKTGRRAMFALSAIRDKDGQKLRICVGSTVPSWTVFGDNAIWGEINMTKCKFKYTPKVQTALIGDANHYQVSGTSSVYNLAKNVFRIYLENMGKKEWRLTPYYAHQYNYEVHWTAYGT